MAYKSRYTTGACRQRQHLENADIVSNPQLSPYTTANPLSTHPRHRNFHPSVIIRPFPFLRAWLSLSSSSVAAATVELPDPTGGLPASHSPRHSEMPPRQRLHY